MLNTRLFYLSFIFITVFNFFNLFAQDDAWTIYNSGNELNSDLINSISVAKNGSVYVGYLQVSQKIVASSFNGVIWQAFMKSSTDSYGQGVKNISITNDGRIYISYLSAWPDEVEGTAFNQLRMDGLDTTMRNTMGKIVIDDSGRMWAALYWNTGITLGRGFAYWDTVWHTYTSANSKLPDDYINDLALDSKGNLWIATNNGAARRSNDGTWTNFDSSNGFNATYAMNFAPDTNGTMWVATLSGLYFYDGSGWTSYNSKNSALKEDRLYTVAMAKKGDLWVGSENTFLYKFDRIKFTQYSYSTWKNYFSKEISNLVIDSSGNVWMTPGLGNGLFVLHPDLLDVPGFNTSDKIHLSPNPAENYINIQSEEIINKIEIYSILGIKLIEKEMCNKIDINFLSPGIYFCRIEQGKKVIEKEFVKN